MLRLICTSALVLLITTPALAFEGRVVDTLGKPLANAQVYILGRPGDALTDADGRFTWKPDPAPPFEILVVLQGGLYMKPVLIESLDAGGLTVTVEPVLSEAVFVSGSAPGIESTPAAGTDTLSSSEIAARQPSNLIQALENVAGVSQVSEGQAAVPAVRGMSGGRTLILIDGARVTSERRVGPSATFLDPAIFEGVDVSRGPGGVAYGSDAFGGVIAVRTRRAAPDAPWSVRANGLVGGAGQPEYRLSAEASKGWPQGGALFAAHTREADDWESPQGEVFNSGYSDHGFFGRVDQQAGPGILDVAWQTDFGRDIERPRNNSTTVRFFYPNDDSHRFTANYNLRDVAGVGRLALSGFVGTMDQTTDQDRFATATTGRSIERAVIAANDFHVKAHMERLFGRARFESGLDVNGRFDLNALEGRIAYDLAGNEVSNVTTVAIDNAHRTDTGAFASVDTSAADWLSVAGGIRGDYVTTENTGGFFGDRSTSNGAASGFFAVTAGSFGGFSITGQVARGFRDPTLSDRYFRGPTGRGFITGNPDLEPETSLQYDLALRYAAPRFRVGAFYYHYDIDDLIERYQTTTDFFFFRNSGQARIEGFEVEAQSDLGHQFTLDVAAQISDGELVATGANLDGIAPVTFSFQLRRQFHERGYAQVRTAFYAEDEDFGPTERVVNGYTMLDLSGGITIVRPLEIRVIARNLLNEEYFASQDTRAVLAPGGSVAMVAAVKF